MWIALTVVCCSCLLASTEPVKLCVRESLSESCRQMALDLPENFQCIIAPDDLSCLRMVHEDKADVTRVDPRSLFLGGKHFNLVPIATELVDGAPHRYQAVAVVSKNSDIQSAADLRGRPSCHTGVGRTAGWAIPLGRLMAAGLARPADCNDSELDVVEAFFGNACAPGNWSNQPVIQEELKKKHSALCSKCSDPSSCSGDDSYAGYEGTLRCLSQGYGEVAFTKMSALREFMTKNPDFSQSSELLCFEGGRKALDSSEPCFWGSRPTDAFMASSVKPDSERNRFISVLMNTQTRYSVPQVSKPDWYYKSFLSSPKVTAVQEVGPERNTYQSYLGDFISAISKPRESCINSATFCVTSEAEASQVSDLRLAAEARGLWPPISFVKASGSDVRGECVLEVKEGRAHFVVLDGGDVYSAGKRHGLQPVAVELNAGSDASYYAVAVISKALEDVKKLADLRGKRSCHTGLGRTAGWVMPVGELLSEGLLGDACDRAASVAEFFTEGSCVPGANNTLYNPERSASANLCRRCVGDDQGMNICSRSPAERYNGYSGSFRCLTEGAGDVAFVKHSTVSEHVDGKGSSTWDKDLSAADYRLLCAEGRTDDVKSYLQCNLGKVPSHHVMTGPDSSETSRLTLAKLLGELSRYFGADSSLYRLFGGGSIFGRSAEALRASPLDSTYEDVLGEKFLAACRATDPEECH